MTSLVNALLDPRAWPVSVARVEHIETHISHVFLVGAFAYKVKKAVDLGFLNFSTLEKRRFYCGEELRLNRRTAPELYLARVPIARLSDGTYAVEGEGEVVEYAVKMRRFDPAGQLDRMQLEFRHMDALADTVAAFHAALEPATREASWGEPERVWSPMGQNFDQILSLPRFVWARARLEKVKAASRAAFEALRPRLAARKAGGWIRECHGDLHLGNIAWVEGKMLLFDAIEFDPDLRWIDVANDVAFLLMDLEGRGLSRLGWRFLNRYLEWTGDFEAVALLPFYQSYRAMVRAKVAAIRCAQQGETEAAEASKAAFESHMALAEAFLEPAAKRPVLIITHGVSGSGKSRLARRLAQEMGWIHLRSDVERKRLFGLAPDADSGSAVEAGIYTPEATRRTYERLAELAESLLSDGRSLVVDATFLESGQRTAFRRLAERAGARFRILSCTAPEPVLRRRVAERAERGGDPSEADLAVLARQLERARPLDETERAVAVVVDTTQALDTARIGRRLSRER